MICTNAIEMHDTLSDHISLSHASQVHKLRRGEQERDAVIECIRFVFPDAEIECHSKNKYPLRLSLHVKDDVSNEKTKVC